MPDLIREHDLAIRLMRDDETDYELMSTWLTNPRVLEFYEGRDNPLSLSKIKQKFSPRILGKETVTPCLISLDHSAIGYAQFYPITEETKSEYAIAPATDIFSFYATDQFIGEPNLWNQGIGTRAVSLLLRYLFESKNARKIFTDPHSDNPRAIRCYEKSGFKKVKLLPAHELHEGTFHDSWIMEANSVRS